MEVGGEELMCEVHACTGEPRITSRRPAFSLSLSLSYPVRSFVGSDGYWGNGYLSAMLYFWVSMILGKSRTSLRRSRNQQSLESIFYHDHSDIKGASHVSHVSHSIAIFGNDCHYGKCTDHVPCWIMAVHPLVANKLVDQEMMLRAQQEEKE